MRSFITLLHCGSNAYVSSGHTPQCSIYGLPDPLAKWMQYHADLGCRIPHECEKTRAETGPVCAGEKVGHRGGGAVPLRAA
jgi:hypothetical protein